MKYEDVIPAVFMSRPNRFIAHCMIEGSLEACHVKNTGRCRELLIPGVRVYLEKSGNPNRKTGYDLIAVKKGDRLINMDSQAPNKIFSEWLLAGGLGAVNYLKPEKTYGSSRFDFYAELEGEKYFIEVKGVTLEEDGVVRFPDAPTLRGVKHLNELSKSIKEGYKGMVVFIIQMEGAKYFTPNNKTHPEFGRALIKAERAGVKILALDCKVTADTIIANDYVKVIL